MPQLLPALASGWDLWGLLLPRVLGDDRALGPLVLGVGESPGRSSHGELCLQSRGCLLSCSTSSGTSPLPNPHCLTLAQLGVLKRGLSLVWRSGPFPGDKGVRRRGLLGCGEGPRVAVHSQVLPTAPLQWGLVASLVRSGTTS